MLIFNNSWAKTLKRGGAAGAVFSVEKGVCLHDR